ncbi:phosphatidylinositol 3,4,5-trisphosphate 5-phosphatase 2-like isoform X2 [Montipora foliosa]|uniref:phosphatidylinositol 3,4,5-trisphosphate 5-phosphatase 2-like isoform X2 n=1 Tax=Montipora foliosa TaxID=591990 RepID=UPI0035F1E72B
MSPRVVGVIAGSKYPMNSSQLDLHDGKIHHYRIWRGGVNGNFYMQAVPGVKPVDFAKLEHLVTFYSQPNQGLPCELCQPVAPQECNSIADDETDDEDDDVDEGESKPAESEYDYPYQFKSKVDQLDSENVDQSFNAALGLYLGEGLRSDMETVRNGGIVLEGIEHLLASTSASLIIELQSLLSRINVLQSVFNVGNQKKLKCPLPDHSTEEKPSFKLLMDLLAESIAGAKCVQTQALDALREVASINQEEEKQEPVTKSRIFEVMTQGIATSSFKNKLYILVNYAEGKISFPKNLNDPLEANNTVDQSKVVQLVKSKDNIKRLQIKIESKPAKDFEFDDGKSREVFCQLVQQMKNQHSNSNTIRNQASVFIGTWNMGNANPSSEIKSWFKCQGKGKTMDISLAQFPHDIYAIGTQECPVGEKDWIVRIKEQLKKLFPKKEFYLVGVCSLWSIRLVVFANQVIRHMISHVQLSSVKTGIANALGNKGGVGISFSFGPLSLCFVNCHLAARGTPARVLRRNQNFLDILNGLNLGQRSVFGITHQFHHVFWFGDLNYRVNLDVEEVLGAVQCNNFGKMKNNDQLIQERQKGNVLLGFEEDSITFPPTYRYKRGSSEYTTQKVKRSGVLTNVPSWCDRVLRHSFPQSKITCTSYGCTEHIRTSDHWPVFCTFNFSLPFSVSPDQTIPKSPVSCQGCEIVFCDIVAKIKTNSKTQFFIEFHSSCLEEMQRTAKNNILDSGKKHFSDSTDSKSGGQYSYPEWNKSVIPTLCPIISDHDYLAEQHLLLAIKSVDNDESYGECCISLRTMINVIPQMSMIELSHLGEKTGQMKVKMHVKLPENNNEEIPLQSHDLISVADLDEAPVIGKGTSNAQRPKSTQPQKVSPQLPERVKMHVKLPENNNEEIPPQSNAPVIGKGTSNAQRPKSTQPQKVSPQLPERQGNPAAVNAPPIPKRHSAPVPKESITKAPPPLPEKKSKPRTVQELMQRIGFPQYTKLLLDDGFDDFVFLADLNEEELTRMRIPKDHHRMILQAIRRYTS